MIIHGDSLEKLKDIADNSIDAVVTDPPYGLAFMGKKWDYDVPSVELWREVFRVLKPGGHLLSFGGNRTYHRMVVNIEDAGFEIRDQIQWLYGSGFPKSLDVSKAIDKAAGAEREVVGQKDVGPDFRGDNFSRDNGERMVANITAPSTPDAIKWQGWGTALKPANEPICLARKPLSESTVAKNVLKWGVGGINVDGCRIPGAIPVVPQPSFNTTGTIYNMKTGEGRNGDMSRPEGRFPANLILDEVAADMLDLQSGLTKASKTKTSDKRVENSNQIYGKGLGLHNPLNSHSDSGGASRFFYCAKASKSERNAGLEGMPEKEPPGSKRSTPAEGRSSALGAPRANHHPTVKPIKLMRYLCKLITQPNGTVLDPFMGSGTTGVAAKLEGFNFIGIEREAEYVEIAKRRMNV